MFIALKDFKTFSLVTIVSLLIQIITITLIGKYTDKNIKRANNLVTIIKTSITLIFLLIRDKLIISINKTVNDNISKVYETTTQTSIQNIIKESKEDNDLLSAVGQMSLCFTEVIVFAILSILSVFIENQVFYVIFVLSIISTIFINYNINRSTENK